MVEVTQNIDMDELMISQENENCSSKDYVSSNIKNAEQKTEEEEEESHGESHDITNGVNDDKITSTEDVTENKTEIDNNVTTSDVKMKKVDPLRDAGSDLDALLDKLSTIVDCDGKQKSSDDSTADREENIENDDIQESTTSNDFEVIKDATITNAADTAADKKDLNENSNEKDDEVLETSNTTAQNTEKLSTTTSNNMEAAEQVEEKSITSTKKDDDVETIVSEEKIDEVAEISNNTNENIEDEVESITLNKTNVEETLEKLQTVEEIVTTLKSDVIVNNVKNTELNEIEKSDMEEDDFKDALENIPHIESNVANDLQNEEFTSTENIVLNSGDNPEADATKETKDQSEIANFYESIETTQLLGDDQMESEEQVNDTDLQVTDSINSVDQEEKSTVADTSKNASVADESKEENLENSSELISKSLANNNENHQQITKTKSNAEVLLDKSKPQEHCEKLVESNNLEINGDQQTDAENVSVESIYQELASEEKHAIDSTNSNLEEIQMPRSNTSEIEEDDVLLINDLETIDENEEPTKHSLEATVNEIEEPTAKVDMEINESTKLTTDIEKNSNELNSKQFSEESDDVVICCDKEVDKINENSNELKSKQISEESNDVVFCCETEADKISKNSEKKDQESKPVETASLAEKYDDDDVVLILEDDDEAVDSEKKTEVDTNNQIEEKLESVKNIEDDQGSTSKSEIKESKNIESEKKNQSALGVDNSDNACDQFEKNKESESKRKASTEDFSSDSSSNLLCPAEPVTPVEEPISRDDVKEDLDDDVEVIEDDTGEEDASEVPAKRARLNEEAVQVNTDAEAKLKTINEDSQSSKSEDRSTSLGSAIKRSRESTDSNSHSKIEETDSKDDETPIKKTKIDEVNDSKNEIKREVFGPIVAKEKRELSPVRLYPAPKFAESVEPLKLEFFKRFRKSFDQMSKADLEELVLIKVVEAIQFKGEFSDIREKLEQYETTIESYRRQVAEVKKQFLDLEMVHKRLKSDLETKNSQFIMPVKITRAVGLQVGTPYKKVLEATMSGTNTNRSGPQPSASNVAVQRSPQRQVFTPSAKQVTTPLKPLPRDLQPMKAAPAIPPANVRRGCVQKITPQRPMPPQLSNSVGVTNSGIRISQANQTAQNVTPPQKVLNKNVPTTSQAALAQAIRGRLSGPSSTSEHPTISVRQNLHRTPQPVTNKPEPKLVARRSEPVAPIAATVVPSNAFGNANVTTTNLTSAKPKEKAVIDLTDEDDTETVIRQQQKQQQQQQQQRTPAARLPQTQALTASAAVRQRTPALAPLTTTRTAQNSQVPRLPTVQQRAQPPSAVRQIAPSGQRLPGNASLPPGTNITRVQVGPTQSSFTRAKFSSPPPLPSAPAQPYNKDWKLPPPRPTIRISLLENGIVISWAMEESMMNHAECVTYQIYAYQETRQEPRSDQWRHVGDVKAMLLPMAVTLNQFQENQRYFFAVRAIDEYKRLGPFSLPKTWA